VIERVKVLYIGGWMRSGSTLLDMLLGGMKGFFSTGELGSLWERGLVKRRQCGCGRLVLECPVWTSVLDAAYEDAQEHIAAAPGVMASQQNAVRLRNLPRLLAYRPGQTEPWPDLDLYLEASAALYRGIAQATNARVVVNSSKVMQEAAILPLVKGVEPYLVHLVRDPRAVAHSMTRKVMLQEGEAGAVRMPRSAPASSAAGWMRVNLAAELVKRRLGLGRTLLVRYEDFVARPRATLTSVASFVNESSEGLRFVGDRTVELDRNHTVWGNPSRFRTGIVEIRHDDEWKSKLSGADRFVPTLVALPLMPRYGYSPVTL
jgi:Sulfotransferase family